MFGCCDSTSRFLDDIERIDTEEKRPLTLKDIPPVPDHSEPVAAADALEAEFLAETRRAKAEGREPSLRRAIFSLYAFELVGSTLLRLCYEGFNVAAPFILRFLVRFMARSDDDVNSAAARGEGYGLAIAFSFATLALLLSLAWSTNLAYRGLQRLSCGMMLVLQRKLFKLPSNAIADTGRAQTLIIVESQSILLNFWIGSVLANPIALVANCIALWFLIGWPGLLAASVLVIFAFVQAAFTTSSVGYREKYLGWAEVRVRRVSQVLSATKLVKMFGWERVVEKVISDLRAIEVGPEALSGLIKFRTVIIGMSHAVPQLSQLAVFGTVFGLYGTQSGESLFPVIVLLNSARITVASWSLNYNRFCDLLLSIDRWQSYLESPERTKYVSGRSEQQGEEGDLAVKMPSPVQFGVVTSPKLYKETRRFASNTGKKKGEGDAAQEEKEGDAEKEQQQQQQKLPDGALLLGDGSDSFYMPILEPIQLQHGGLKRNTLTILSGSVAAGKTVLCNGLIGVGDIPPPSRVAAAAAAASGGDADDGQELSSSPSSFSPAVIAHVSPHPLVVCPAEPWILNATLRENIVMVNIGEPPSALPNWDGVDVGKYAKSLFASGLAVDLGNLPRGDLTEIGASGINLSGGQKARVSLARAVYAAQPGSIVFLDDVLSAVDPALVRSLFTECIGDQGALRHCTRLLVSHQKELFSEADRIIQMDNRRVVFDGSPEELEQQQQQQSGTVTTAADAAAAPASVAAAEETMDDLAAIMSRAPSSPASSVAPGAMPSSSSAAAAAATTVFENEADFSAHVRAAWADNFAPVDGKKKKKKQQQQQEEQEDAVDASAGTLTVDAKQLTGSTKFAVFMYYARSGGLCLGLAVQFFFLLWRSSIMVSDLFLALWTEAPKSSAATNLTGGNTTTTTPAPPSATGLSNDMFMAIFAVLIIASLVAIFFRTLSYVAWVRNAAAHMHARLFSNILRAPMSWHDTTKNSEPLSRLSKDMEQVDVSFAEEFYFSVSIAWNTMFFAVSMCIASIYLLPFLLVVFVFYEHSRRRFATGLRAVRRLQDTVRVPAISSLGESVAGLKCGAVQAGQLERKFLRRFTAAVVDIAASYDSFRRVQCWVLEKLAVIGFLLCFFMCCIAVTVRVAPVLSEAVVSTSFLNLGMSFSAALSLNLSYFTSTSVTVLSIMSAIERIAQYNSLPHEIDCVYTTNEPIDDSSDAAAATALDVEQDDDDREESQQKIRRVAAPPASFPEDGSLEFHNVSMRYRPRLPLVLKKVSFQLKSGEKVGIVGRSGDSKSSLGVALFRLAEMESDGGSITLSGRDIRDIRLHDLRTMVSTIPQDASGALFAGTVRSNLSPWSAEDQAEHDHDDGDESTAAASSNNKHNAVVTDADLERALELVGLRGRIFNAKRQQEGGDDGNGLDTVVESGGANFSSGERQLLVLARALLRRSKWLFLDEASSNTDDATDNHIQRCLQEQFAGVTFLIIAHRIGTLIHCDKIVVMHRGEVAEFDTPANLLRDPTSRFRGMVAKLGEKRLEELTKLAIEHELHRENSK